MPTAFTPVYPRSVLQGFGYNFATDRTISIGTSDGGDDIMTARVIPAGCDYFPLPTKVMLGWDTAAPPINIYFNGIDDTEDVYAPKFLP